jgi:uncharacterized protein (DUF305 family)
MASSASELPDLTLDQLIELERRAAERGSGGDIPRDDDERDGDDGEGGGDTVWLPWWQHPTNIVTMIVASLLIAGMVGWMLGDARSRPSYNAVDVGFLQDMRIHHEQAVYMSFVYRELPDTSVGLEIVAGSIIMGQNQDIGRMVQLLRDFGEPEAGSLTEPRMNWMGMSVAADQMPGLASDADLDRLSEASGDEADQLFAELMIAHHEAGVHMAEHAADNADNDEVVAMATSMARSQSEEISEIRQALGG